MQMSDSLEQPRKNNRYAAAISAMIAVSITAGAVAATPAYAEEEAAAAGETSAVVLDQKSAVSTTPKHAAVSSASVSDESNGEVSVSAGATTEAASENGEASSVVSGASENGETNEAAGTASESNAAAEDGNSSSDASSSDSNASTNSSPAAGDENAASGMNNATVDTSATPAETPANETTNANSLTGTAQNANTIELPIVSGKPANKIWNSRTAYAYDSLYGALVEAQDGDTLLVDGTLKEGSSSTITKKLTIAASVNGGKIRFMISTQLTVDGGDLTLGDGDEESAGLELVCESGWPAFIVVEDGGVLTLKNGVTITNPKNTTEYAIYVGEDAAENKQSSFHGEGGTVKGGEVHLGENCVGATISGGTYENTGNYNGMNSFALYNDGQIESITGGTFTANEIAFVNFGTVKSISGGSFTAKADNWNLIPSSWLEWYEERPSGLLNLGTITEISGGEFNGTGNSRACGLSNGLMSWGRISNTYACSIGKITGGNFNANSFGIFNGYQTQQGISSGAVISNISDVTVLSRTSSGLENYGEISAIANSTFTGADAGVRNRPSGIIEKLVSGTYVGLGGSQYQYGFGYINLSSEATAATKIEIDLDGGIGAGRYWGGKGFDKTGTEPPMTPVGDGYHMHFMMTYAIYGNVILPYGYSLTTKSDPRLPSTRADIDGYSNYDFRYLKDNCFRLSYNGNGATGGATASQKAATRGERLGVAENGFTRPGYKFVCWSTRADGMGTSYIPYTGGTMTRENSISVMSSVILYAQWEPYKLSYDANATNATGKMEDSIPAKDDVTGQVTVSANDPTGGNGFERPGWKFIGWNTKSDGTGTAYTAGTKLVLESDLTLYSLWESYALTYNANAKTATGSMKDTTVAEDAIDAKVKVSANDPATGNGYTRPGWKFTGWNTQADGQGDSYASDDVIDLSNGGLTLYAQWEAFTLSYDKNANSATGKMAPATPAEDDATGKVTVSANGFERPGWKFAGWKDKDDNVYAVGKELTLESDLTLYAQWEAYKLSYDKNSEGATGTMDDTTVAEDATDAKVKASANGFDHPGWKFTGWNTKADGTGDSYAAGETIELSEAGLTLYAQWEPYKLSYNGNGAISGTVDPSTPAEDDIKGEVTVSGNGFERPGWHFLGWKDASGNEYTIGQTMTLTDDLEIIAQWEAFKVNYFANATNAKGSVESGMPSPTDPKATIAVAKNGFDRAGWKFTGWKDEAGNAYEPGATVIELASDLNLYAQWEAYALTYDANASKAQGSMEDTTVAEDATDAKVKVSANDPTTGNGYTLAGFRFAGWNTQADGQGDSYAPGSDIDLANGGVTLYAQWEAYKITYDKNATAAEGEMEDGVPSSKDEPAITISDSVYYRLGYKFTGWKDTAGNVYAVGKDLTLESDLTLYAQWEAYKITYDPNASDSTGSMNPSVPASAEDPNAKITVAENGFVRDGYKFIGWNTAADGSGYDVAPGYEFTLKETDLTLYAQWEKAADDSGEDDEEKADNTNTDTGDKAHKIVTKAKNGKVVIKDAIPKTGDGTTPFGAAILAIASLLAGFFARFRSRKAE